uniref:Proline rich 33 n=1 Tax=Takifugu rubripes TaxID=31033 RepID=A0A674MZ51_TAKRU
MALAYSAVTQLGLFSQQYPPPLLPKPRKDNMRLQKLLKRNAKKKTSAQGSQTATYFRSSLSPVDEASPDLEHSDRSTPPKTPETQFRLDNPHQPPRITVRPLYQHVASPYPHRANYEKTNIFSLQTMVIPSCSQNVSTVSTDLGPQLETFRIFAPELPGKTVQGVEMKKAVVDVYSRMPTASDAAAEPKHASLGVSTSPAMGVKGLTCPLTVLTPLVKPKSPRPTFKATEPSRFPKPMFDVPQIRIYTASTSYYESSKISPVYDSAGLTAIGSVTSSKTPTIVKQESTLLLGQDPQKIPSFERKIGTTEIRDKRHADTKRIHSPLEIKPKTSSSEFQVFRTERPKAPAKHITRAVTPVFEISRPNPLLFAVSPAVVEVARAKTSHIVTQTVAEFKFNEAELNGDINSDMTPAATPIHQSLTKSEPDLTGAVKPATPADSQLSRSQTTSYYNGCHRPKTPSSEAARLMTTSPGYKRPKTPTYTTSGVSPVAFQRPKTPTEDNQKSKCGYRGLTPAEYAAHGGIKTHFPAFGFSTSQVQIDDEIKSITEEPKESQIAGEEPQMEVQCMGKMSTFKELLRDKIHLKDETVVAKQLVPTIVITQETTKEVQALSTQEKTHFHKATKNPAQSVKSPTQVETLPPNVTKAMMKTPDIKHFLAKSNEQDHLNAVQKAKYHEETTEPSLKKTTHEVPKPSVALSVNSAVVQLSGSNVKETTMVNKSAAEQKSKNESLPNLSSTQKSMGMKSKVSGWSRLKKHMVVEQEEPKFPETDFNTEANEQSHGGKEQTGENSGNKAAVQETQTNIPAKATKMWDAVLFQMFATKENIMHQIELSQSETETKQETKDENNIKEIPSFVYKLPVLLFSPKFDAKKLKEAASRPVTKISTVFEMALIGCKGRDEEPKDFNRTARGFAAT